MGETWCNGDTITDPCKNISVLENHIHCCIYTHVCIQTPNTHTRKCTHTHTHTHTQVHTHTHKCTHTHTSVHTHTQVYTHTHTHTHSGSLYSVHVKRTCWEGRVPGNLPHHFLSPCVANHSTGGLVHTHRKFHHSIKVSWFILKLSTSKRIILTRKL